ncbi:MAG: ATP-binding cassette domain-containing protein [Vicinamibacterales bacterium]
METSAQSTTASPPPLGRPTGTATLVVADIQKTFRTGIWPRRRSNHVLRGVSFELFAGTMVGLVGENGSGKSVLMRIIAGSLNQDLGIVVLDGRLGYCPQVPMLYEKLTCDETFALFGRAYNLTREDTRARAHRLYEVLSFGRFRSELVEHLSGGTRQKLNLAIALLNEPTVLLLDEPYAGFDWETYQVFWSLAGALRDSGTTILIISHFLHEQERFDRILRLVNGTLESGGH